VKPRIALATYDRAPGLAPDDQLLLPALAAAGIDAEPAVWSSDDVTWETYDGVVVRSCWDYHRRASEFRAWIERLDAARLPVWNSTALVNWNSNKRYLMELAGRGVPTIPTELLPHAADARATAARAAEIIARTGWRRAVVKPAVSASGHETYALAAPLDDAALRTISSVAALGDALLQPLVPEVARDGELSLIFIDGVFSHAAIKRARPGEFRVQTDHGGSVAPCKATPAIIGHGALVLDALPETPLYARIDGVVRGEEFLLMELELIEPNLFFALGSGSADRFAQALAQRLRSA
jgi:glutathione synthase/RimK-type ligase-like ATP-grasp enzyme